MTNRGLTSLIRVCALALGLALAATAAAAPGGDGAGNAPTRAERALAAAKPPSLAPVRRFAPAASGPQRSLVRRPVALVGRTPWSERPARPVTTPPRFPVLGRVSFGEGGARFGASRGGRSHDGQDVFARPGTPLVAVRDAVVLESSRDGGADSGGRGNYVAIYSPEARQTYVYLHLIAPPQVRKGDRVRAGQRLGGVGCSGSCSGDHLHFELRSGRGLERKPLDPMPHLRRWSPPAP